MTNNWIGSGNKVVCWNRPNFRTEVSAATNRNSLAARVAKPNCQMILRGIAVLRCPDDHREFTVNIHKVAASERMRLGQIRDCVIRH